MHVHLCTMIFSWYLMRPEEHLGIGITDGCQPPHGFGQLNSDPLSGQAMLTAAEPFLQPQFGNFLIGLFILYCYEFSLVLCVYVYMCGCMYLCVPLYMYGMYKCLSLSINSGQLLYNSQCFSSKSESHEEHGTSILSLS